MSAIPKPYEKTTVRNGKTLDELTNYALYAVEYELGYTRGSLTVLQGSWSLGSLSGNTHAGGGAVDLTDQDHERKVKALRKVGFAAWYRPFNWDGKGGEPHIHAILISDAKLSLAAQSQVEQYEAHPPTDGLAFHRPDPDKFHPNPIPTFVMPARPVPKRRVFHVHKGQPYRFEDSFRGVMLAKAQKYGWIDLDCHVTKDGVLVITHWPRPRHEGFRVPGKSPEAVALNDRIAKGATIESLTWAEVEQLRTPDHYRIWRADDLLRVALRNGLNVELEMKTTAITAKHLGALRGKLSDPSRVQVKALPDFYPALEGAHKAGFVTLILGRKARIPATAQPFITYRRGPVNWS